MIHNNVTYYGLICKRDVYDPLDAPKLAFIEGESYRGCLNEDGIWEVHSHETNHVVNLTAEDFEQCFTFKNTYTEK